MEKQIDAALLITIANMVKARFTTKQIAAALGISTSEAVRLIGMAVQASQQ